jgi:hypothetical protein
VDINDISGKLLDYRLGELINFGAPLLKDGIKRIANGI